MGRGCLIALLCALCLCSCRSVRTEYVPIMQTRSDTLIQYKERVDSVWRYDSVHVREGRDTVWMDRWHVRVERHKTCDTLYINKTDSIPKPYPVERPLTRWQRTKQDWGGWSMLVAGVAVSLVLRRKI